MRACGRACSRVGTCPAKGPSRNPVTTEPEGASTFRRETQYAVCRLYFRRPASETSSGREHLDMLSILNTCAKVFRSGFQTVTCSKNDNAVDQGCCFCLTDPQTVCLLLEFVTLFFCNCKGLMSSCLCKHASVQ